MSVAVDEAGLTSAGEAIDRLVTVEMRLSPYARGVLGGLYDAARAAQGGGPLSLRAARALNEAVHSGDVVLLTTGAGTPQFLPCGETDGPPGVAALAAAVSAGLGAVPLIVTEPPYVDVLARTALAAGLGCRSAEAVMTGRGSVAVLPLAPSDAGEEQARAYDARFRPAAVIAVEKAGPNAKGVTHLSSGGAVDAGKGPAHLLFDLARARGALTIGVGDNGNEIGFGLIAKYVRAHRPYGAVCRCPCGAGIATRVETDVLVPANTSNWGAYGIIAALALLRGQADLLHGPETERRMIEVCVDAGAADGSTGRHLPLIDGTPLDVQVAVVTMLRAIVRIALSPPPPPRSQSR